MILHYITISIQIYTKWQRKFKR